MALQLLCSCVNLQCCTLFNAAVTSDACLLMHAGSPPPFHQGRENFEVMVDGANSGGVVSRLGGLALFIPVSQLHKRGHGEWWTEGSMREEFVGTHVRCARLEAAAGWGAGR